MQAAEELLSPSVVDFLAHEIRRGGGNEVFFVGTVESGLVTSAEVLARGNEETVPALLHVPRPGQVVLHNHPSGTLKPSQADVAIAARLGNDSIGFYIVDNTAENIYSVVGAFERQAAQPIAADVLQKALSQGGALASALKGFEERASQLDMMRSVSDAFEGEQVALLEAGTGTGKTFAYLLPAVDWAVKNRKRVVVATHTINLQEQILRKDAPALAKVFGDEYRVVLVKGRSNYVSLRRAKELEENLEQLIDPADRTEAESLVQWALRTSDGSRADLAFEPKGDLWEKIQSETDNCLRHRCPTFQECHFFKARRAALTADVMVANHHLVFADLAIQAKMESSEGGLLPGYQHVIFDEAHHIEDVATTYFGHQVTRLGVRRASSRLLRENKRGRSGALLVLLTKLAASVDRLPDGIAKILGDMLDREVRPAKRALDNALDSLFDAVYEYALGEEAGENVTVRLVPERCRTPAFEPLKEKARVVLDALKDLVNPAVRFLRKLDLHSESVEFPGPVAEFSSAVDRLAAYGDGIQEVLLGEAEGQVRWIEASRKNPRVLRLATAPVEVDALLEEHLFRKHKTVILTSATLAVAGDMRFLKRRTGIERLDSERVKEKRFDSPFDFATQARCYALDDLPQPDKPGYEEALAEALPRLLEATEGRSFVLFTSFRSLDRQFRAATPVLERLGIRCLRQGDASRDRLLDAFRNDRSSVLFGTDSFWEGVDVEGESLSSVILTRLPFRVPTEPVTIARSEAIEAAGGYAFGQYTIPQAVIKFRQGFGRLIRSTNDRGVVIVTDKRIVSRPYGRKFRDSLPLPVHVAPTEEVLENVRAFFSRSLAQ